MSFLKTLTTISAFLILFSTYGAKSNPDISLNGLFIYRNGSEGENIDSEARNGFALQEAELRITSNIDSYFRGDVVLALEEEVEGGEAAFHVEPEDAFVETLTIPNFTIRMGKFYPYWGRHNQLHTHSYPFIDAPLTREAIFGEEGFNESGIAISYLVPTPWYFEVVLQGFSGANENVFGSSTQNDFAQVVYLKNLWDLTSDSTLEFDLGAGQGKNANDNTNSIYNASLTYKWKPASALNKNSFDWTTEYTLTEKLLDETQTNLGRTSALSSWIQYQFDNNWVAQLRGETVNSMEKDQDNILSKTSVLIGYITSEYSAIRFQYDEIDNPELADKETRGTVQLNISMGTHPAHSY